MNLNFDAFCIMSLSFGKSLSLSLSQLVWQVSGVHNVSRCTTFGVASLLQPGLSLHHPGSQQSRHPGRVCHLLDEIPTGSLRYHRRHGQHLHR